MERTTNEFKFTVDFTVGTRKVVTLADDLRYIQERIQTHRAIYTNDINEAVGRYFESAVTLVTVLKFILAGADDFTPVRCQVSIEDEVIAAVAMKGIIDFTHSGFGAAIPVDISLMYTAEGAYANPTGFFSIDITPSDDIPCMTDDGQSLVPNLYGTIGNCTVDEVMSPGKMVWKDDPEFFYNIREFNPADPEDTSNLACILANPNQVLRYCDNFPAPSILSNMARMIFDEIYTQLLITKRGGTKHDVEIDTEWTFRPGEAVPEEEQGREAD